MIDTLNLQLEWQKGILFWRGTNIDNYVQYLDYPYVVGLGTYFTHKNSSPPRIEANKQRCKEVKDGLLLSLLYAYI